MVVVLSKNVTEWSSDDVETYLTSKKNGFSETDIKTIREKNVDGEIFLELTKEILISEFKFEIGSAVKIMKLVKELSDDYSYPIPNRWHKAEEKLRDLCFARIIRVNDELRIKKRYDGILVDVRCRVTNTDHGILSITIIGGTGPDWDTHREILANGNFGSSELTGFEDDTSSPFDRLSYDYIEDILGGEKIEGISKLSVLEEKLLDKRGVVQTSYEHSEENILISRNERDCVSIKYAIEDYRIKRKTL